MVNAQNESSEFSQSTKEIVEVSVCNFSFL